MSSDDREITMNTLRLHHLTSVWAFSSRIGAIAITWCTLVFMSSPSAFAQDAPADETWAIHGQFTNITQGHPHFAAAYSGKNSLSTNGRNEETTDLTLFAGVSLWRGAELWLNPEIDQGFGFDNTVGMAGFPNGGAYKVGANLPYLRIPRAFIRQAISLGDAEEIREAAANQLAGSQSVNNLTLTVGKFAVVDVFDTNRYAHDPRADFLNWAIIEGGAFDYAADSWGYTLGAAAEWTQDWWTLRGGVFRLSAVPNGKVVGFDFRQNSVILEAEQRHQWRGHPGKVKLLAFVNRGDMAGYADAVHLGLATSSTPDVALVRRFSSRPGLVLNVEQELTSAIGAFARLSSNRGGKETFEFADINQAVSAGLSIQGDAWGRHDDTLGIAAAVNRISGAAQAYFAAGGLGVQVGDGRMNYAPEQIQETYYSWRSSPHSTVTLDYQHVDHPAYNQDRGPVSIYGVRLHAEF